jgi:hypothetical protein
MMIWKGVVAGEGANSSRSVPEEYLQNGELPEIFSPTHFWQIFLLFLFQMLVFA